MDGCWAGLGSVYFARKHTIQSENGLGTSHAKHKRPVNRQKLFTGRLLSLHQAQK